MTVTGAHALRCLSMFHDDPGVYVAHRFADIFAPGMKVGCWGTVASTGSVVGIDLHDGLGTTNRLTGRSTFCRSFSFDIPDQLLHSTPSFLDRQMAPAR